VVVVFAGLLSAFNRWSKGRRGRPARHRVEEHAVLGAIRERTEQRDRPGGE
jgi:hypothetical protein